MQWRQFNFLSKTKKDDLFRLFLYVEQALKDKNQLRLPALYFDPSIAKDLTASLVKIAVKHRGTVVEDQAQATHIVEFNEAVDGVRGEEADYLRTLTIRADANLAQVHWWYFPDSYDEWIPLADVEGNLPEADPVGKGAKRVCCRFVKDVAVFNEHLSGK